MTNIIEQVTTPEEALLKLKEGNFRFLNNMTVNRDSLNRIDETKDEQSPYAAILSCMDSRISAELVFDQGLGDIFGLRIAGNVVTDGILGSLEYAVGVVGSKLIMVMGHTNCGAIKGACDHVKMGYLTSVLEHIQPAIDMEKETTFDRTSHNAAFVNNVMWLNVLHSVDDILTRSTIIRDLVDKGKLAVVPAIYNVATGKVSFSEIAGAVKAA
jgi:carbonic anhydrase